MAYTLEQFSSRCHDLLKAEPGPAGRRKVCELLQEVLKDQQFISTYLKDETPDRQILYEDAEMGFCILAHNYKGAKISPPHDHGDYWAIYGQALGETDMSDFELLEAATTEKAGKVRRTRTYKLTPGVAHLYNEGDLHSPSRANSTRLIRIEGRNMETVRRLKYQEAA